MEKYPNVLNARFSQEFVLESLKIILQNNSFAFGNKHFLQTKGTAMGTKVAPTYATLTLGYLEEQLLQDITTLWGEDEAKLLKSKWKRFLDDCFILWSDDMDKLMIFHKLLNELNPDIKFTMEVNDAKLPFLDVLIIKEDDRLSTDVYYKSTDTHQYLHFGSCHPHHTKQLFLVLHLGNDFVVLFSDGSRNFRKGVEAPLKNSKNFRYFWSEILSFTNIRW